MADLQVQLNPNEIEPAQNGFDLIPPCEVMAHIVENEVTSTKSGNGLILKLTWEILEGPFENRKVWQNINYQHESAQAQAIGSGQVKNICDAIGYADILTNGDVLMHKPCRIKIGMAKPQTGYETKNEIKGVKPCSPGAPPVRPAAGASAPKPAVAPKPAAGVKPAAAPPPGAGSRPWLNKATTTA